MAVNTARASRMAHLTEPGILSALASECRLPLPLVWWQISQKQLQSGMPIISTCEAAMHQLCQTPETAGIAGHPVHDSKRYACCK